MTLNTSIHKTILFQILKDIYSDTKISPYLGFKGGTATLMFYNLDRFSVDLDFDLLDVDKADLVFDTVVKIVSKYGKIKDQYKKRHNLFCLLSYEDKAHNIKVEISLRKFDSSYEVKNYLGVGMLVMVPADMFAHKLVAMYERLGKTSRDLYDVWFFLKNRFPINKKIVETRSEQSLFDFIEQCIQKIDKLNNRNVLDGVGELLTEGQKDWAKAKLKQETISLLELRKND